MNLFYAKNLLIGCNANISILQYLIEVSLGRMSIAKYVQNIGGSNHAQYIPRNKIKSILS